MALYSSSFLRRTESTADVFYSDGKGHCFSSEAQGWGRLQARVGMRPVRCPSYWHFMRSTSESRPRPWLKNEPTEPTTRFGVHAPRKQPATGNDLSRDLPHTGRRVGVSHGPRPGGHVAKVFAKVGVVVGRRREGSASKDQCDHNATVAYGRTEAGRLVSPRRLTSKRLRHRLVSGIRLHVLCWSWRKTIYL